MAAGDPGAASAELVTGWCIFGLLLLVWEVLGVFPVFRRVGEGVGPALGEGEGPALLLAPPRAVDPRPAPLLASTVCASVCVLGGGWLWAPGTGSALITRH